ncbi:MAG TPA: CopL family metal-binding regulatory protein [Luteimonas sp.]|nr:CopL family metal-binding regulatory protein [Luteimonas sp.]
MRLLLIVALLANGPGIAGASMHVEHLRGSMGEAASVTAQQAVAIPACHDATVIAPVTDHQYLQAADQAVATPPLDDCCETANCYPCMHHCSAALAQAALADFNVQYRQTVAPFLSVHASAALTNLFRPPIG